MLAVPLFLAGTIIAPAGAGILFAALIVTYRDVRYVITFVDAALAVRHASALPAST